MRRGGSGALAIKDGLDTAYVGWNPESDMGNIEIWEQNMPMLYLGRSIVPNSGGAGKYRGGCSFISTWLINKTSHLRLVNLRTLLARVRQCRHVRRLSRAHLPDAPLRARHEHPRARQEAEAAAALDRDRSKQSDLRNSSRAGMRHQKGPTSRRRTNREIYSPTPITAEAVMATSLERDPKRRPGM
jgi:hypothetical protein